MYILITALVGFRLFFNVSKKYDLKYPLLCSCLQCPRKMGIEVTAFGLPILTIYVRIFPLPSLFSRVFLIPFPFSFPLLLRKQNRQVKRCDIYPQFPSALNTATIFVNNNCLLLKHFFLLSFTTVLHISLVLPLPQNFQKSRQSKNSSEAKLLSELQYC